MNNNYYPHSNVSRPSLYFKMFPKLSSCSLINDFVRSCKDRVYPELQRLLGQQDSRVVLGRDTQWEQILARAACLRDICRERSDHHTPD